MTEPLAAAERWRELLVACADDPANVDPTDEPRSHHDTPDERRQADADTVSARWAREVLPPRGGTVLDVGCGAGRAALALVPPASEVIGVDRVGAMLDEFVSAAESAGVARRTVHGAWPEIAPATPIADVAVCHGVVFEVGDVVPFLWALTDHARLAVVIELPARHPRSAWSAAWRHFHGVDRPDGLTHLDLVAVLREMGLDPELAVERPPGSSGVTTGPADLVPIARRLLCLPTERDAELAAWLAEHPPAVAEVATLRWPGEAHPT